MKDTTNLSPESRRDALKRARHFIIPTVAAFQVSKLAVAASGGTQFSDWADAPYVD